MSRADKFASLEALDNFSPLRNKLRQLARERGDWAGIPMPLENEHLIVEPKYPNAQALMDINAKPTEPHDFELINQWYCARLRCEIFVFREQDGRITHGKYPAFNSLRFALGTLGCAEAWGIEQESRAVQLLGTLVSHRQFKQYMLTGTFLESSKRSGIAYLFRRLRPTVAIASDIAKNTTRVMCALCMHPIAYYRDTWAGAMCPTDDVVAHLTMMRADEPMFWRRSTQHPAWRPEAGL